MHRRDRSTRLARAPSTTIVLLLLLLLLVSHTAFGFSVTTTLSSPCFLVTRTMVKRSRCCTTSKHFRTASNFEVIASRFSKRARLWESSSSNNDNNKQDETNRPNPSDTTTLVSGDMDDLVIIRGSGNDDLDGSIWAEIETGQPPQWMVMKQVRGKALETKPLKLTS
jgi:hypothetical protein